jgi:hypothetical protein
MGLLINAASRLKATEADIDRGRLALACLSTLPEDVDRKVKELLGPALSPIDQLVEENAALVSWNRDPYGDSKFMAFLKNPSLETGREYARYSLGEPYVVGFEELWLNAGLEAATEYLKYFRLTSDRRAWENKSRSPRRPKPQ